MAEQERQHAYVALTAHDHETSDHEIHDHSEDHKSHHHDHIEDHPVEFHHHG